MMKLSRLIILAISFCGFLLAAGGHEASAHEGGWMEKWLSFDPGLFMWTIVTFLIVLAILKWKAWGPLMDALDAREKQIEESLFKAEKVTAEAEQQAEKNEEILNAARKEAQNIVAKARDAGDQLKQKLESDGKDQHNSMLKKAKDQIENEKKKALNEIKNTVVEIAIKASEKVIKRNLNNEDNKKMIEQTVNELKEEK